MLVALTSVSPGPASNSPQREFSRYHKYFSSLPLRKVCIANRNIGQFCLKQFSLLFRFVLFWSYLPLGSVCRLDFVKLLFPSLTSFFLPGLPTSKFVFLAIVFSTFPFVIKYCNTVDYGVFTKTSHCVIAEKLACICNDAIGPRPRVEVTVWSAKHHAAATRV